MSSKVSTSGSNSGNNSYGTIITMPKTVDAAEGTQECESKWCNFFTNLLIMASIFLFAASIAFLLLGDNINKNGNLNNMTGKQEEQEQESKVKKNDIISLGSENINKIKNDKFESDSCYYSSASTCQDYCSGYCYYDGSEYEWCCDDWY